MNPANSISPTGLPHHLHHQRPQRSAFMRLCRMGWVVHLKTFVSYPISARNLLIGRESPIRILPLRSYSTVIFNQLVPTRAMHGCTRPSQHQGSSWHLLPAPVALKSLIHDVSVSEHAYARNTKARKSQRTQVNLSKLMPEARNEAIRVGICAKVFVCANDT